MSRKILLLRVSGATSIASACRYAQAPKVKPDIVAHLKRHPFRDANGRLHVFLMLNKFLIEQGFKLVILTSGPEIFGGSYSIGELTKEVENGMKQFTANIPKETGNTKKEKTA